MSEFGFWGDDENFEAMDWMMGKGVTEEFLPIPAMVPVPDIDDGGGSSGSSGSIGSSGSSGSSGFQVAPSGYGMIKPTPYTLSLHQQLKEALERADDLYAQVLMYRQQAENAQMIAFAAQRELEAVKKRAGDSQERADDLAEQLQGMTSCVVCLERPRTHMYRCGHFCVCEECAALQPRKCVLCRERFPRIKEPTKRVYLS